MATRSIVRIQGSSSTLMLYRHWDGYPASHGAFLAQTLKKLTRGYVSKRRYGTFSPLANELNRAKYDSDNRPMYEIMDGDGDCGQEWEYTVDCRKGTDRVMITVKEIPYNRDPVNHYFTEKEFRSFCARDLLAMRKRMQANKARQRAA